MKERTAKTENEVLPTQMVFAFSNPPAVWVFFDAELSDRENAKIENALFMEGRARRLRGQSSQGVYRARRASDIVVVNEIPKRAANAAA